MNQIKTLGDAFVEHLRQAITPEQFLEVVRLNSDPAQEPGVCASHDFCDANMVMADAFKQVVGRDMVMAGGDSAIEQADHALWSAAWEYARAAKLSWTKPVEYVDDKGQRVAVDDDDGAFVEFYPSGGGFQCRLPHDKFYEIFSAAPTRVMRRGRVDADWMDEGETLPCWSDGSCWNGWSMPFFPREAVDKLIAMGVGDTTLSPMHWEGDSVIVIDMDQENSEDQATRYSPATMPDGSKAWDIGAGWWCWNSVQFDEEAK